MQSAAPLQPPRRGPFHPARRIKPLQAARAMRRLLADPEATGEVFRIIEALKGGSLTGALHSGRCQAVSQAFAAISSRSSTVESSDSIMMSHWVSSWS